MGLKRVGFWIYYPPKKLNPARRSCATKVIFFEQIAVCTLEVLRYYGEGQMMGDTSRPRKVLDCRFESKAEYLNAHFTNGVLVFQGKLWRHCYVVYEALSHFMLGPDP